MHEGPVDPGAVLLIQQFVNDLPATVESFEFIDRDGSTTGDRVVLLHYEGLAVTMAGRLVEIYLRERARRWWRRSRSATESGELVAVETVEPTYVGDTGYVERPALAHPQPGDVFTPLARPSVRDVITVARRHYGLAPPSEDKDAILLLPRQPTPVRNVDHVAESHPTPARQDPGEKPAWPLSRLEQLPQRGLGEEHRVVDQRGIEYVSLTLRPDLAVTDQHRDAASDYANRLCAIADDRVVPIREVALAPRSTIVVCDPPPGRDLECLLERGPLDPAAVLHVAAEVAAALEVLHGSGVVHGNLKPATIWLEGTEPASAWVRLAGFGVVPLIEPSLLARGGKPPGAPAYAAPEMVMAAAPAHPSRDIYALAALLVHLASGRPLFDYDSPVQVLFAHARETSQLPVALPEPLRELVAAMLVKDPAHRPTAAELRLRLRYPHDAQ
ncbi:MAG: protein kinase domain-containing protein [Sporichthyaceae bacterium]